MEIKKIHFDGAAAIELKTSLLRLAAVHEYGPRIAHFGRLGKRNLLLWAPGKHMRGDWDLRGGHRVWATRPLADECEETYRADNTPAELVVESDGFRLTGALDDFNKTRRGFSVRAVSEDALIVDNFLVNLGEMLFSGGVWALTCTVPAPRTKYCVPLSDASAWDTFQMTFFKSWGGHRGAFDDPQIVIDKDMLLIEPGGQENKRMLQCPKGLMAMSDPESSVVFLKKTRFFKGMTYPRHSNLAFYIGPNNFMVEMETMSPEMTLMPGETLHHEETWKLLDAPADANPLELIRQA
jgi:hypothetical protein